MVGGKINLGKAAKRLPADAAENRWKKLPSLKKGLYSTYRPTVTGMGGHIGVASVVHPVKRIKFTIAELRKICAFPDDFVLVGSGAQQWARLGNAVPPVMMMRISAAVWGGVLARISGGTKQGKA